MKTSALALFVLLLITFLSCRDEKVVFLLAPEQETVPGLEQEIDSLKENISKLQSVILLQAAHSSRKKIVSATEQTIDGANYRVITFSDHADVRLPVSVVKSIVMEDTGEYKIELSDGQILIFNNKERIYPVSITLLAQSLAYMRGTEIMFEFRVNPSNATFNYDLASTDCNIAIDETGDVKTYSYVHTPDNYSLVKIEPSVDDRGMVKEGQYRAYIRDKGETDEYKDAVALVLSFDDANGDKVSFSSSVLHLERKKFTNLPVVVIRTENERKVVDKENWISGKMTVDGIGLFPDYEGEIAIRGRGNATWSMFPKKPYAIKLETKESILGMPRHKRWVLLANYLDRTLLRNHIAFEISRRTDLAWTPRGQYVEVMLNDLHLGNYYLCEQVQIDENRINIAEMTPLDLDEEAITGGYLMEFDTSYDEVNKFISPVKKFPVMFKEPEEDILRPAQFEYMQNYIGRIEHLLYKDETFPRNREYVSMIDEVSFIDFWLVMELTGIVEPSLPRSCYFYKDRNGLLKAGPVWDFDNGAFVARDGFTCIRSLWYDALFKDPVFVDKAKKRWALLKPRFKEVIPLIEEYGYKLQESEDVDAQMWWNQRNTDPYNGDEHLSYKEALGVMKSNYERRITQLDNYIRNL